ncbi:MAG TPA: RsmG family class I SAM-dependent methyltransferase [Acidimicrobiales bacterium]|nr:RsmG family class I SAM-dependent methyltransferase [Acidimicrobiales bacterium]
MASDWLREALEESRTRGFLGPGPIDPQIQHAEGFILSWHGLKESAPGRLLDLGSGGGIPGLVLAERWRSPAVFLDSVALRTAFLRQVLGRPGAPAQVEIVTGRAESLARQPGLEGTFDLVVARSFGPPAVTAECAARFAAVGGLMIVSEPPESNPEIRWPAEPLEALGWRLGAAVRHGSAYQILEKVGDTPLEYPRAVGRPGKRPLF